MNLITICTISLLLLTTGSGGSLSTGRGHAGNARSQADTVRTPTVEVEKTMVSPMSILMIRDTAAAVTDISRVLGEGYVELFTYIDHNHLKPGKVMAFYHSPRTPLMIDVAVEVDSMPRVTTGRIKINKVLAGNAVVAHYRGPYEQIGMAYAAIGKWLKQQGKNAHDAPFEVYLNDPMSVKDPSELRTDVYQFVK
jgi:effector-binding domain-containing protein